MGKNIYKGMRYVPLVLGEWDNTKNTEYEPLSVVTYSGNSYTSKKDVPIGIDITNTDFWIKTADYNVQVAQYKNDVENYVSSSNTAINDLTDNLDNTNSNVTNVTNNLNNLSNDVSALPQTHISTLDPTPSDGTNGDIWIKYTELPPTAIDSITLTVATLTGVTVKANKNTVPMYWDSDTIDAVISFDVYLDGSSTPYGNYNWEQISAGIVITGQTWAGGSSHSVSIKTKSVSGGITNYSNVISSTFIPLSAPSTPLIKNGNGYVNISFVAVAGASSYTIKRSTTSGSGFNPIATDITSLSFNDGSVINGTNYYYVITAKNINGESANSQQATGAPQLIQAQWLQFEIADNQQYVATGNGGAYTEICEIEVNTPDILPSASGSWSASSIFGAGFESYLVADGVLTDTSRWISSTPLNQWLKVNLGSLQSISNFRMFCGLNLSSFPYHVKVYKSTLATPSEKTFGVSNADWVLCGNYGLGAVSNGWLPYNSFTI